MHCIERALYGPDSGGVRRGDSPGAPAVLVCGGERLGGRHRAVSCNRRYIVSAVSHRTVFHVHHFIDILFLPPRAGHFIPCSPSRCCPDDLWVLAERGESKEKAAERAINNSVRMRRYFGYMYNDLLYPHRCYL